MSGKAQDAPVGSWESHLPYNSAVGVATDGNQIFTICNQAFFIYNNYYGAYTTYSKVDGMSDIGMQCVAYDAMTQSTVLVYTDGNIDIFKDNTFYNIPDLKLKVVAQLKQVFQVYTDNGYAYLSTTLGVLVIDLTHYSIYKTYQFNVNNKISPVLSFTRSGQYFYAVTQAGLYRADKDNPLLEDTQNWVNLDSQDTFQSIVNVDSTLFLSTKKRIFTIFFDSVAYPVYSSPTTISHIDAGYHNIFIGVSDSFGGAVKVMNTKFKIIDGFECNDSTVQAVQLQDSSIWVASPNGGLKKRTDVNKTTAYYPDGPTNAYSYDLYANNRNLYIAHGGYNGDLFAFSSLAGFSNLNNGKWTYYKAGAYPPLNYVNDISSLAMDEISGTLYAGSYLQGLFVLNKDGTNEQVDPSSMFDGSIAYGAGYHQIYNLAFDNLDNLWVVMMFANDPLYVKTKDGTWYKYPVPYIGAGGGPIVIDDSEQVWLAGAFDNGLVVINTKNTINDTSDDIVYHLTAGAGNGNLPSNGISCIAKDKKNKIWIGTDNGIAVFNNCMATSVSSGICEAEIPVLNYNNNSGPLFQGDVVISIAIDAIDRKWVGTHTGVYLLSEDATQVIYHFTQANSPLPSDIIQKITIDKVTGDVYIGTDRGLVCYRGNTIDGTPSNDSVLIFPNPVPGGYTGTIAIKGLVANSDVRITDINGQLVYRTKSLGGQAIWNGLDYTGHRPQSGIYLVFVSDSSGKQTYTGKIAFIQ